MIKILLILSSAMLIATAIFGVLNRQSFIAEAGRTEDANNKWKVANQELVQAEETLADAQEELKSAKDDRDQQDAKLTLAKEKQMQKERSVKELEKTLEEEGLKLKEFEVVLAKMKDPVTGETPSVEKLNNRRESLTNDVKAQKDEAAAIRAKTAEASKFVKAGEAQIQQHIEKQRERAASFIRNGFEATITAVNSDWGFVIIDAGKDKGVKADSALLVSTAEGVRVGKLSVISIEPTVTVADIDMESLSQGARIQPGYKVIYEDVSE